VGLTLWIADSAICRVERLCDAVIPMALGGIYSI
jgi:hypothetical protein